MNRNIEFDKILFDDNADHGLCGDGVMLSFWCNQTHNTLNFVEANTNNIVQTLFDPDDVYDFQFLTMRNIFDYEYEDLPENILLQFTYYDVNTKSLHKIEYCFDEKNQNYLLTNEKYCEQYCNSFIDDILNNI